MNQQIEFNPNRYFAAVILSLLLVSGGMLLFIKPDVIHSLPMSAARIQQLGLAMSIIFLGLLVFVIIKLARNKVAFEITNEGIQDFAGGIKAGLIEWKDISHFTIRKHMAIPFVVVHLKDEQILLDRINKLQKRLVQENSKTFGSPLAINATMYKCSFDQFHFMLEEASKEKGIEFQIE